MFLDAEVLAVHPRENLERLNLFVIPLDYERRWYRYHHLFRDLLRQRLIHKVSPEEIARVHLFASEWLEANGDIAEAFHHASLPPILTAPHGWQSRPGRPWKIVFRRAPGLGG